MKLYHVCQNKNLDYDSYSDFVVCAESEEEARHTHPSWRKDAWASSNTWCESPDQVNVKYLGEACPSLKKGIICASFHAG